MATRFSRRAASVPRTRRKLSPKPASRRMATRTRLPASGLIMGCGWASYLRGELPQARAHATAFLRDVEARPDSPEASVAHRILGTTHWFAGEYVEARDHLERALALFQPGRDDDLAFRFGHDAGVAPMIFLAIAL